MRVSNRIATVITASGLVLFALTACGGDDGSTDGGTDSGGVLDSSRDADSGLADSGLAVTAVAVEPLDTTILIGATAQFTATATLDDGSTQDVTAIVQWEVTPSNLAVVSASGLVAGVDVGAGNVTASLDGVTGSASLAVMDESEITSIEITPRMIMWTTPGAQNLRVDGTNASGLTMEVTHLVSWTASPAGTVAVGPGGRAVGLQQGSATIRATLGALTDEIPAEVRPAHPPVTRIAFNRDPLRMPSTVGATLGFSVFAEFVGGERIDVTSIVDLAVSDETVLSIDNSGFAELVGAPSVPITGTAMLEGLTGEATFTFSPFKFWVALTQANRVVSFDMTTPVDGDAAPVQRLAGGATMLGTPEGLFVDSLYGELWVGSQGGGGVLVFSDVSDVTGDSAPVRSFSLGAGLASTDLFYDRSRDVLYVSHDTAVFVYDNPRTLDGGTPRASRSIDFPVSERLRGLTVDEAADRLFIAAQATRQVFVIDNASRADGAIGTLTPRVLAAGVGIPSDVALDVDRQRLYVSGENSSVAVYDNADMADAPAAATATLSGSMTTLGIDHDGVLYDPGTDELYVSRGIGAGGHRVLVFAAASTWTGSTDLAPTRTVTGPTSLGSGGPGGLAIGF